MPLYANVNPSFDFDVYDGTLVCSSTPDDVKGFTEKGYDAYDPGVDSDDTLLVEVTLASDTPNMAKFPDLMDVLTDIAPVYDNWDTVPVSLHNTDAKVIVFETMLENWLIAEYPEVRKRLSEAGFDGYRDYIVVSNTEPLLTVLWDKSKYTASPIRTLAPAV